jgi:hypothetical protein
MKSDLTRVLLSFTLSALISGPSFVLDTAAFQTRWQAIQECSAEAKINSESASGVQQLDQHRVCMVAQFCVPTEPDADAHRCYCRDLSKTAREVGQTLACAWIS